MGFINTKILKFSIAFLCGILAVHFFEIPLVLIFISSGIIFPIFIFFFFRAHIQLYQQAYFGISCYLILFLLGSISYELKSPENRSQYFSNLVEFSESLGSDGAFARK